MTDTNRDKDTSLSTTALTTVYTVPSGYSSEDVSITVTLTDDTVNEVEVTVEHLDSSASTTKVIGKVTLDQSNRSAKIGGADLRLEDSDQIKVSATVANAVDVDVSCVETDGAAAVDYYVFQAPATTIAADAHSSEVVAKYAGTIASVTFTPALAMTGDNTNYRTVSLENRGQAGAGTVKPATLAFTLAVNGVAFDEKAIPLSGTPSDLAVAAGDVLSWESVHTASGIVDPGGVVRVGVTRS